MEYVWLAVGVIIGVPVGWALLAVGLVRWTVHAAEVADSGPEPAGGTEADRRKGVS